MLRTVCYKKQNLALLLTPTHVERSVSASSNGRKPPCPSFAGFCMLGVPASS